MKIQTFSIVAGSTACNARCPFCISKMTVESGVTLKEPEVNWRNFEKACLLAKQNGVTTAMLTSKGEPTLFPAQISKFLRAMQKFEFPFIEIQSNGILIADQPDIFKKHLNLWFELGLTHFSISIVHYLPEENKKIYLPYRGSYIDLPLLIKTLHQIGLSIRLTCTLANGLIDSPDQLDQLINFAKNNQVEQLTVRPVNKPEEDRSNGEKVYNWVKEHALKEDQSIVIDRYVQRIGRPLITLAHGASIFDINGQNLCLTDCLTISPDGENIRQLIFFPDGYLRYDWQYEGAILM